MTKISVSIPATHFTASSSCVFPFCIPTFFLKQNTEIDEVEKV